MSKKQVIAKARRLGLSTSGTVAELESRINEEKIRLKAQAAEDRKNASEFVEKPVEKPVEKKPKKPQVEAKEEIPRATPIGAVDDLETAIATKTTVKFVGGWQHLKKGKSITASKSVISALRQAGLIEKD